LRDYELMVVLDPNLDEAAIEALTTRIQTMVTQRGGVIDSVVPWGRQRLAYPIGRYRDGIYILIKFKLPPNAAGEIERALKLTESIIRHLVVRTEEPAPAAAAAAAASGAEQ
jgi:small subunit ribosomal protein S6